MFLKLRASFFRLILLLPSFFGITFAQTQYDVVRGNLVHFNDNGIWC